MPDEPLLEEAPVAAALELEPPLALDELELEELPHAATKQLKMTKAPTARTRRHARTLISTSLDRLARCQRCDGSRTADEGRNSLTVSRANYAVKSDRLTIWLSFRYAPRPYGDAAVGVLSDNRVESALGVR